MNQREIPRMTIRLAVGTAATVAVMLATGSSLAGQTPADVAGDWVLTGETDAGGPFTSSVMLEQDGTELTGQYSSANLGELEVKGSVSGNDITFSRRADLGGQTGDVTYTATLQDDGTLSGQIDLAGLGGGSITGKRR